MRSPRKLASVLPKMGSPRSVGQRWRGPPNLPPFCLRWARRPNLPPMREHSRIGWEFAGFGRGRVLRQMASPAKHASVLPEMGSPCSVGQRWRGLPNLPPFCLRWARRAVLARDGVARQTCLRCARIHEFGGNSRGFVGVTFCARWRRPPSLPPFCLRWARRAVLARDGVACQTCLRFAQDGLAAQTCLRCVVAPKLVSDPLEF